MTEARDPVVKPLLVLMPRGRVGSNLLTSQLNGHRRIKMFNEALTGISSKYGAHPADRQSAWAEQKIWLEQFLAELPSHAPKAYVGVKVDFTMIGDPRAFISIVHAHRFEVIYIYRANVVKQAVSLVRARANAQRMREKYGTALWGIRSSEDVLPPGPVDVKELEQLATLMMRQHVACEFFLNSAMIDFLPIEYARFTADLDAGLRRVEAFLGVEQISRSTTFVKSTPDDLAASVTNITELRNALRYEPFASMLVEGSTPSA
jgi:hypothetical protein